LSIGQEAAVPGEGNLPADPARVPARVEYHQEQEDATHRVGRVLSFFSSRQNWDSPQPLTRRRVWPHPPRFWGEGHTWGWENPNSDECTYTVVLLLYTYFVMRPHIPVPRDTASFSHTFLPKTPAIFCILYVEVSWFCQRYSFPQSAYIGRDETG
jgi:hypothetical protein